LSSDTSEPMDQRAKLNVLVAQCETASPGDEERLLRSLAHLLGVSPGQTAESEETEECISFEAMLAAMAYESAAIALLGPSAGLLCSRSPDGICIASVWLPESAEECHCTSRVLACAILGAFAAAVLDRPTGRPVVPSSKASPGHLLSRLEIGARLDRDTDRLE